MRPESLICTQDDEHPRPSIVPPGFKHQPPKAVVQLLAACQVSYFRELEVEGITIFHSKENTHGSSLVQWHTAATLI